MSNLSFNDGYKEFTINSDESKVIRINISDVNLADRLIDFEKFLNKKSAEYSAAKDSEQSLEEIRAVLSRIDRETRDELDRILDTTAADIVFGNTHCLSPVDGQPMIKGFLTAVMNEYDKQMKKEFKKADKYVNAAKKYK